MKSTSTLKLSLQENTDKIRGDGFEACAVLFPDNPIIMPSAPVFANFSLPAVENVAFTALSPQPALPQDLGSGQVSLFSVYCY